MGRVTRESSSADVSDEFFEYLALLEDDLMEEDSKESKSCNQDQSRVW